MTNPNTININLLTDLETRFWVTSQEKLFYCDEKHAFQFLKDKQV